MCIPFTFYGRRDKLAREEAEDYLDDMRRRHPPTTSVMAPERGPGSCRLLRLAGDVLIEVNDEWRVKAERRGPSERSTTPPDHQAQDAEEGGKARTHGRMKIATDAHAVESLDHSADFVQTSRSGDVSQAQDLASNMCRRVHKATGSAVRGHSRQVHMRPCWRVADAPNEP